MKYLITGGAGFIGSNLARSLIASGDEVRVLDDLSTGRVENLNDVLSSIELVTEDVRDEASVRRALRGVDVVFHLAALPSVARSVADPVRTNSINVDGTLTVLTCARGAGVSRVVFASSSSVYGDTKVLPKHEQMPVSTMSPYAVSKLTGEAYSRAFFHSYGLETVSLRFFNVFGPRQDPASDYAAVIPRFITSMQRGSSPVVFGDGRQTRDFTFIANVVQACRLAAAPDGGGAGEAFNVGCGERVSLLDLIGILNDLLDSSIAPSFASPRIGDVRDSLASIDKATEVLGYQPLVSVRQGLAATVEWFAATSLTAA